MPKPTRPFREQPLRHALYQVVVEAKDGSRISAGPKCAEELANSIAVWINRIIFLGQHDHLSRALGVRKQWGKAEVVLAKNAEFRDTRTIGELLIGGR